MQHRAGEVPPITGSASAGAAVLPDGTVTGAPRRWLRLEGAVLAAGSLTAYPATGQAWWLVPLALLVPDVLIAGYLRGSRPGAQLYNLTHSTALPAAMIGLGWWQGKPLILALGLIWLAHVGLDRLLGYGLKYDDHFQHTHLGHLGRPISADRRGGQQPDIRAPRGPAAGIRDHLDPRSKNDRLTRVAAAAERKS